MAEIQKDLVLSPNSYAFVLDETKGNISCNVGPHKMSLSQSDSLVRFDENIKDFVQCKSYSDAIHTFTTIPEGWYCVLKNPTKDNRHPVPGTSNPTPTEMLVGKKINIAGPGTFALWPGQMVKVIKGHALRTNQYLLARVYEAEAANNSQGEMRDAEGNLVKSEVKYTNGQILVIKGTDVSYFVPGDGIEVIPVNNDPRKGYTREAVTLERMEYCILKDEDGSKRYVHGSAVVFPKATEQFIESPKGGLVFRAIELSPITGIYIKVITEYEENGTVHPVGEEMFITGNQQMIYYPRPEHAIIQYDGKLTHHAIAIPAGEGRYIMNRLNGDIRTVVGPAMYLPDPRTEVVVKRKLSAKQCQLWYPGNNDAILYNDSLNEKTVEKATAKNTQADLYAAFDSVTTATASLSSTLAYLENNASLSRGTSYTKPRTITLDTRFDGVVSLDIWTGYAVNIISKNGDRKVVCGPRTVMLDYDQTLEELHFSTGRPKTTNNLINTVYLRHENNKVSDIIEVETKDFVNCSIKVSYTVSFDPTYSDKWFSVENYIKLLCDRVRMEVKRWVKNYNIEEFYQNYIDIVRIPALMLDGFTEVSTGSSIKGRFFPENGMVVTDCEVLNLDVRGDIEDMLLTHQNEMIIQSLKLSDAEKRISVAEKLATAEKKEQELRTEQLINKMALQRKESMEKLELQAEVNRRTEAEALASKQAESDLQAVVDSLHEAKLDRQRKENAVTIDHKKNLADIEKAKQDAYAETIKKIITAIGPDLVAAMNSKSNADLTAAIAKSLSPYALAGGNESASDVVNKLLRGTVLKDVMSGAIIPIKE